MAIVIWLIVGLALWHLTIFVPDHFWGGIVGALLGGVGGALVTGALVQAILGRGLNDVDMLTFLAAIPGFLLGSWLVYWIGERNEDPEFQLQD
jgi:tetrahydromethanopterin S-methyltransferase subunit D